MATVIKDTQQDIEWSPEIMEQAKADHVYINLGEGVKHVKLAEGPIMWGLYPYNVYIPSLRVVGTPEEIRKYFSQQGYPSPLLDTYIGSGYTIENYNTTKKEEFEHEVAEADPNTVSDYMKVFGFPQSEEESDDIHPRVLYGFAYYNPTSEVWRYYVGTFVYLYGVFQTVSAMEDEELYVKTDEGDVYEATLMSAFTFLYVNKDYEPIGLIGHARVDEAVAMSIGNINMGIGTGGITRKLTLRDLSYPGGGDIPKMEFEY